MAKDRKCRRENFLFLGAGAIVLAACAALQPSRPAPPAYPVTAKTNQIDTYHGVRVPDPYRWLEDDNSPETKAWVEAQNKVTFGYLEKIPERDTLRKRLTELWNYERYGVPVQFGGRYFYTKNDGLQNQSVLYSADSLESPGRPLLDPNKLSKDGTVALSGSALTEDGKLIAYGLSEAGSDWQRWKVRDVGTGEDLTDEIRWVKFSGASWTKDGSGFFYSRYREPDDKTQLTALNRFHKLYFHHIGSPQAEDTLIYERPDKEDWGFSGGVTEDGRYLIISVSKGTDTKNGIFYKDLQEANAAVVELLPEFDALYDFITNDGPIFWFRTDSQAPRGRVVSIDIRDSQKARWKEIIGESKDTLRSVSAVNDQLIATYLKDASSAVRIFELGGKPLREVPLPGLGAVGGFGGLRKDKETFYSFTSFTEPATIYRYDMVKGTSSIFRRPSVKFDSGAYETKQVFYTSKDGTRIPMFITHKKGLRLNGLNPTYLYGYGGFNISLTPGFSASLIVWMEMGGVYAVPNLRGGGEYGEEWHQAGMKGKKQNVFDDFIAAGEWLIANRFTSRQKLAIGGGSNGGLLVGSCMTQRPDLFAAALPAVGVMDMLRFHKFTIGWAWTSDYGSADNADDFKTLHAYSPLHHLRSGTRYPSTLITTADHDDRVVPAHSFKFAAALQEAHRGDNPVLIRIETRAGHGAGKPTTKVIEEQADRWAFLCRELNIRPARTEGK